MTLTLSLSRTADAGYQVCRNLAKLQTKRRNKAAVASYTYTQHRSPHFSISPQIHVKIHLKAELI